MPLEDLVQQDPVHEAPEPDTEHRPGQAKVRPIFLSPRHARLLAQLPEGSLT
jgi:hypothetical protein